MARSGRSSDTGTLIESLRRTRHALERLIAELETNKASTGMLTVSDEQSLRRAKRALRKINNDHLPWAWSPALTPERASAIAVWLIGIWSSLPLEDTD
jgi:hypothetical protein